MSLREQNLLDSLISRLEGADIFSIQAMTKDVENSEAYKDPTHADHTAHLKMVPLLLGAEMKLNGEDPQATHTMEDNQRFTHDLYPQDKPLDFSSEDRKYDTQRNNIMKHISGINSGKITHPEISQADLLQGAHDQIRELDSAHDAELKNRAIELKHMEALETGWDDERSARSAQMKKDFMTTRLRSVAKAALKQTEALAEDEWRRLQSEYGV